MRSKEFVKNPEINRIERTFTMMRKRFMWIGMLMLTLFRMGLAQPPDSTMQLSALIEEALENNPDLQSAQNTWQAARAKIPQAGALPDPLLVFNLMNMPVNTFAFDQEPMTSKQLGVMQMFPFPGKQGVRENIARENAAVAEARYQELRNQLVKNVKATYFDLFLVDKSIETVQKNLEILQEFVRIAETKYSVGSGLQQDVLRAQVELSKMTDKLINLQKKRDAVEARLNALLNRPAELADEDRPLLQAWQAMIRQSEQQVRLAKKEYLPDFSLGVVYSQREELQNGAGGVDFLSGMINVKLPLYFWRKQKKQVEESRYNQISVQERYNDVRNQVYSGLDAIFNDVQKNERLLNLFETGIIPQASQSLNSAIAGYQTDKVDFLTLLTNQVNLFNFELDFYRILSDHHKGAAEIEALTGTELEY
jgi:outer membrane protein TolC